MERLSSFLPPYVPTRTSARCLVVLLAATAALASVSLGFEFSELRLLAGMRANQQVAGELVWAHALIREVLTAALGALAATSALIFLAWLHRCRINARALGARRFRYSRAWVPIGFLIPGLNFVRPFQVVSEIWRASDPQAARTPLDWKTVRVPPFLRAWWAALVVAASLQLLAMVLVRSSGAAVAALWTARCVGAAADLAAVAAAVSTCLLVASLERSQTQKWWQLNRPDAPDGPFADPTEAPGTARQALGS